MGGNRNLASRLRHRIILQQPEITEAEGGQYTVLWQEVATLWADVQPLKHRGLTAEALVSEQLVARVSHEIIMRYRAGVRADMRVVFNGRYFNIRSVMNEGERGETLRLLVEENVAV